MKYNGRRGRLTRTAGGCKIHDMATSDYIARIDSAKVYDIARVTTSVGNHAQCVALSLEAGCPVTVERDETAEAISGGIEVFPCGAKIKFDAIGS